MTIDLEALEKMCAEADPYTWHAQTGAKTPAEMRAKAGLLAATPALIARVREMEEVRKAASDVVAAYDAAAEADRTGAGILVTRLRLSEAVDAARRALNQKEAGDGE